MTNTAQITFSPDWLSPPGETIADLIEERDWTQAQLADRLGCTAKHVNQLINGKAPISEQIAVKLSRVLGSSVGFWLKREALYRAELAKIEEGSRLQEWTPWLDHFPVKDLMRKGVIPSHRLIAKHKPTVVKEMLQFFGVASPEEWKEVYGGMEYTFRRTKEHQSNIGAISAWIRQGEALAAQIECPRYDKSKFEDAIQQLRELTVLESKIFIPQLKKLCQDSGVAFVIVPSIPSAHVSGMARWISPHKALIQISLYGRQNDRFWFTVFHEAAHILRHRKKDIFLDEHDSKGEYDRTPRTVSAQEDDADQWARETLIPSKYKSELPLIRSKQSVVRFAKFLGIHPAIVVGRLQHDGFIGTNEMNDLKISISEQDF